MLTFSRNLTLVDSLIAYEDDLVQNGKQEATIRSYISDLKLLFEYLNRESKNAFTTICDLVRLMNLDILKGYQVYLAETEGDKSNSIRRKIISIRLYFRFLARLGIYSESPFDQYPIPAREDFLPSNLDLEDLELLLEEAKSNPHAIKSTRDPSLIALIGLEGLKASELIELKWRDFLFSKDWSSLKITGANARVINLSSVTTRLLLQYRQVLETSPKFKDVALANNQVFIAFKGRDGQTTIGKISRHGIKFVIYEIGDKAGFKKLNSEHLRQYAICWLTKIGRSPEEIMEHFGLKRIQRIALQAKIYTPVRREPENLV